MLPRIIVQSVGVLTVDPTFEGGSSQTASAALTNPTVVEHSYTAELYLGMLKQATSGVIGPFSIPAGGTITKTFPIIMPLIEGVYEVYLDVWSGGIILAHYRATEDVTVVVSPRIEVGPIIWQ